MKEVLDELVVAYESGEPSALATVVRTWRSAPRPAGASMLVTHSGEAVGSISGGCVEGAVYELGGQVIIDGQARFETYGISDDDAFAVGLTCGGILEVYVEQVTPATWPELPELVASVRADQPVAVATVVKGPDHVGRHLVVWPDHRAGDLGSQRLNDAVGDDVLGLLESGTTGFLHYGTDGERRGDELEIFVSSFAPKPRMFVFGAIDFAAAVARVGKFLGFHVTVCDAREIFATRKRFPDADEVIIDWPHRWLATQQVDSRTVMCVLTHDPKFDVPVLIEALKTPAAYIGAMGSRRTHEDRIERLREAGVSESDLERIKSPIGLDLGARTPEETAISIAAEIVSSHWGGSGKNLFTTQGAIHPGAPR
ncbi:MAG: XdhC/CoxI family protein [Actinomycetes bacterium]